MNTATFLGATVALMQFLFSVVVFMIARNARHARELRDIFGMLGLVLLLSSICTVLLTAL